MTIVDEWKIKQINAYIGIDLGALYSIGNILDAKSYDPSGNLIGELLVNPSTLFFGANVEAGLDYWFNKAFGVYLHSGYRIAKWDLTGKYQGSGIFQNDDGDNLKQPVDYSGLYINCGFLISL